MEDLKIIIADDTPTSRTILRRLLESFQHISIVSEAVNGEDLMRQVVIEEPHLIFVDISMPILNGIEAAKECLKLLPQLKVVFITGHDDYAVEAYSMSAIDYIVKPIEKMRLFHAVEKARQAIKTQNEQHLKDFGSMRDVFKRLVLHIERTIHFIPTQDIVFIEKTARKAFVHTPQRIYEINETLGALLKRMDSSFVQTHRSYIINFAHISNIVSSGDTHLIYFLNYDKQAYISRNKLNEVLQLIDQ